MLIVLLAVDRLASNFLSLYQWKDLVYDSQISGENGSHSNSI